MLLLVTYSFGWFTLTGFITYYALGRWYVDGLLRVAAFKGRLLRVAVATALWWASSALALAPMIAWILHFPWVDRVDVLMAGSPMFFLSNVPAAIRLGKRRNELRKAIRVDTLAIWTRRAALIGERAIRAPSDPTLVGECQ
jgi:hypothetical protein